MFSDERRSRPSGSTNTQEENSTDSSSASPWPKNGAAGQVQPAKRAAPEWASPLQILAVAKAAYERDDDPAVVWAEVANDDISGGESDG